MKIDYKSNIFTIKLDAADPVNSVDDALLCVKIFSLPFLYLDFSISKYIFHH